ncbi:MAG: TolC family protein [Verrucomicrobiae bacterium]|nr:TolC family protein [Verrucomicrobiae bacterium]NNJ42668.1 TolC family protein [Akkermansiaceae bacterium]
MYQKIILILGTSIAFTTVSAFADQARPIVTYFSIADRVRKQNPDLAAARFRIQEAMGRLTQSGRLTNPELSIETSHNQSFRERALTIGFSQKFPATNRLKLEKEVSAVDVQTARAEISEMERQLIAKARQAVIEYLSLAQQRKLRVEQIKLINELSSTLQKLTAKGEISGLDASLVKLERLQLTTELRQYRAQEKALNGVIKPLLGMPLEAPLIIGGNLDVMTLKTLPTDLDRRGDIRSAKHSIIGAGKQIELEQARRYDDIEVGIYASAERTEDAPEGFDTEGVVGIGVKIPLPFWNKNEGNIAAAKARAQRKKAELTALEKTVLHKAKAAREEMIEWAGLVHEIDNKLFPEAAKQQKLAEKTYIEGLTSIQTVLRSREQKLRLQTSRIAAVEAFHKARANYESQLGY